MQSGYFNTAWQDIKNSPGWFGKLVLLSLVALIPVFGWIVVLGYLYGWARDIAWNVHSPLPAHIFGNEDGRLYSRGFFALVISFVCLLAPWILEVVWGIVTGVSTTWSGRGHAGGVLMFVGLSSMIFSLVVMAAFFFATLFSWVGSMRMSVYGRLSAGFQFGKIWAMIRRNFNGLLRIVGMAILLSVGMGIIVWVAVMAIALVGTAVGLAAGIPFVHTNSSAVLAAAVPGLIALIVVLAIVCGVVSMATAVFLEMMVVRALGYWTQQLDVASWCGQEDPMPFEFVGVLGQPPMQQPPHVPPAGQPPMQG